MVGKKSGRALLREEGTFAYLHDTARSPVWDLSLTASPPPTQPAAPRSEWDLACSSNQFHRTAAHGQQYGIHHLAAGEHDQSEELLYVCFDSSFATTAFERRRLAAYHIVERKMVGRNVLDGLRKGKKDLYALNVQYVKRY